MKTVLIVEDDSETAAFLINALRRVGLTAEAVGNGRHAVSRATGGEYAAIVLDRMLPDLDGLSVLKALRAAKVNVPVLFLSALGSTDERVAGLRAGADDYLSKPFSFEELHARLEALMRRPGEVNEDKVLVCGDLELDLDRRTARRGGRSLDLKPREFEMLAFLMRRQGKVVTRGMLLEGLWDFQGEPQTNLIEVHISRLRRKIDGADEPPLIRTVRGLGYRLSATP